MSSKTDKISLFTDGGSRGNPGPSACAFVIFDSENNVVEKSGFFLGSTTNNQAEYEGLRKGLERAIELGSKTVQVNMDSLLVINQMKGLFKVKHPDLLPVYLSVKELASRIPEITYSHVMREHNSIADSEVNRILDQQ